MESPIATSLFYESRETRETNSSVTRPLDLVLMTKCSGYFLSNISKPYQGFPLDSGPGQSSDVRYLLTRLWCQTLAYFSNNTAWSFSIGIHSPGPQISESAVATVDTTSFSSNCRSWWLSASRSTLDLPSAFFSAGIGDNTMPMKEYFVGTCVVSFIQPFWNQAVKRKSKLSMQLCGNSFKNAWYQYKNNFSGSFSSDIVNMRTSYHRIKSITSEKGMPESLRSMRRPFSNLSCTSVLLMHLCI